MVDIRKMRVLVRHGVVRMVVTVGLRAIPLRLMLMLVVLIVYVLMHVLQWLVGMLMFVPFGQVQPDTNAHKYACQPEGRGSRFPEHKQSHRRTNEWCGRKIGACTRGSKSAQSQNKQNQAESVAKQADKHGFEQGHRVRQGQAQCQGY